MQLPVKTWIRNLPLRLGGLGLLVLLTLFQSGCKKDPIPEYPALQEFGFRVLHQDSSGVSEMFGTADGNGLVAGYHADSIVLWSNSMQVLPLGRQWDATANRWYFGLLEYDYTDGQYGGRDTVEREQRIFLQFNSTDVDTLQLFYKFKVNPNPGPDQGDGRSWYLKDYSKIYLNGHLLATDTAWYSDFEVLK